MRALFNYNSPVADLRSDNALKMFLRRKTANKLLDIQQMFSELIAFLCKFI